MPRALQLVIVLVAALLVAFVLGQTVFDEERRPERTATPVSPEEVRAPSEPPRLSRGDVPSDPAPLGSGPAARAAATGGSSAATGGSGAATGGSGAATGGSGAQAAGAAPRECAAPVHYGAGGWSDGAPVSHLITLNRAELEQAKWWVPHDPNQFWFYAYSCQVPGTVPLYRLYHSGERNHLLTIDAAERSSAQAQGYTSEGIAFYVFPSGSAEANRIPVRRRFGMQRWVRGPERRSPRHAFHFPYAYYANGLAGEWTDEGVKFWVPAGNPAAPPPPPVRYCKILWFTYRC